MAVTQTPDSPTKNFAAISPLASDAVTFSEGNLVITHDATSQRYGKGSITLPQSGKWGFKVTTPDVNGSSTEYFVGMSDTNIATGSGLFTGNCFFLAGSAGQFRIDGADISSVVNKNLTLEILYDAANRHVKVNNFTSGANLVNYTSSGITAADYVVSFNMYGSIAMTFDFGQNGYTPSDSDYSVISASNIFAASAPTIEDGSTFFQPTTYSGVAGANEVNQAGQLRSGLATAFTPDIVWIRRRDAGGPNVIFDSPRTTSNGEYIQASESTATANESAWASFDDNGFSFDGASSSVAVNAASQTYIAWQWLAGSAPTATNSAGAGNTPTAGSVKIDGSNLGSALTGSIPATEISASTTAGCSIVLYSGNKTSGATVAHGLSQAPDMIHIKRLGQNESWISYVSNLGGTKHIYLNLNNGEATASNVFNNTAPTGSSGSPASVFSLGDADSTNADGESFLALCFSSIPGFSKAGSFTGNNDTDGPFVELGFSPAMVVTKKTSSSTGGEWYVVDSARDTANPADKESVWHSNANAEDADQSAVHLDFLSNGFKMRSSGAGSANSSGATVFYMAWAENPFAGTTPTTAR